MSEGSSGEPPHAYIGRVHDFVVGEWRRQPHECCPLCGTAEWSYKGLYELHELDSEEFAGTAFLPVLVIECNGCGYLAQISASKGIGSVPTSLLSALDPCRPLGSSAWSGSGTQH